MTKNADASLKRAIAFRAVLISTVVCVLFTVAGAAILAGLKITVESLLIAGGAILFVFALNMVIGEEKESPADEPPSGAIDGYSRFPDGGAADGLAARSCRHRGHRGNP